MKFLIKGVVHRQDSEGGASTDVLITNELSKGIGSTLKFGLAFGGTEGSRGVVRGASSEPKALDHPASHRRALRGLGVHIGSRPVSGVIADMP